MCFPVWSDNKSSDVHSVEERADRHVRHLIGFYIHLAAFIGVNAMLVLINLLTSPGVFWALWPLLGWGIKVAAHALAVFGVPGYETWKTRVRRRYIRRHADRPTGDPSDEADADETEQLRRRVETLEAIVTSADWDLLADLESTDSDEKQAAALADEVVSH